MKTLNVALLVSVVLITGAMLAPLLMSTARAEDDCPVTDNQVICVFELNKGDVKAKELKIGPFNINGGGGVDQVARDGVRDNGIEDGKVASNVTTLQRDVAALVKEVQDLRADITTLNQSAITDIGLNSSNVTGPAEPPVNDTGNGGNDTGGVILNGTGTNSTGNFTG
jgi:hypothetical protein